MTQRLRVRIREELRRHKVRFWGRDYFVTPRLVEWAHGDGLQVIYLMPLNTRPNYYVLRVDSKLDLSSDEFRDLLDVEIYSAIEDEYLPAHEEWTADNGRTYRRHNYFPALDEECGSSWGQLCVLKALTTRKPDRAPRSRAS